MGATQAPAPTEHHAYTHLGEPTGLGSVITPIATPPVMVVDSLANSTRGTAGFGSTGTA